MFNQWNIAPKIIPSFELAFLSSLQPIISTEIIKCLRITGKFTAVNLLAVKSVYCQSILTVIWAWQCKLELLGENNTFLTIYLIAAL